MSSTQQAGSATPSSSSAEDAASKSSNASTAAAAALPSRVWTCLHCPLLRFPSKGLFAYHSQTVHQMTAKIKFGDGTVAVVDRDPVTGLFKCSRCPRTAKSSGPLYNHAQKCEATPEMALLPAAPLARRDRRPRKNRPQPLPPLPAPAPAAASSSSPTAVASGSSSPLASTSAPVLAHMSFTCKHCGLILHDKVARGHHYQIYHQPKAKVRFSNDGEVIFVIRDKTTGNFSCPRCAFSCAHAAAIHGHADRCPGVLDGDIPDALPDEGEVAVSNKKRRKLIIPAPESQPKLTCEHCPGLELNRPAYGAHLYLKHQQEVELEFEATDGETAVVNRNATLGVFKCPRCRFTTLDARDIQQHAKQCSGTKAVVAQSSTVDHAALRGLDLVYDEAHSALLCLKCRIALVVPRIETHWARYHHSASTFKEADVVKALGIRSAVVPGLLPTPDPHIPAIAALPVTIGHRCTECTWAGMTPQRHWTANHGTASGSRFTAPGVPPEMARKHKLQRWTPHLTYFEVERGSTLTETSSSGVQAASAVALAQSSAAAASASMAKPASGMRPASKVKQVAERAKTAAKPKPALRPASKPSAKRRAASEASFDSDAETASDSSRLSWDAGSDDDDGDDYEAAYLSDLDWERGAARERQVSEDESEWIYKKEEAGVSDSGAAQVPSRCGQQNAACDSDVSDVEALMVVVELPLKSKAPARSKSGVTGASHDATQAERKVVQQCAHAAGSSPATQPLLANFSATRQSSFAVPALPALTAATTSSSSSASQHRPRNAPAPAVSRSFFGKEAQTWQSASRAPLIFKDGSNINRCAWRASEEAFIEEAGICSQTFSTGEALAQHVVSEHVHSASRRADGKVRCSWGSCSKRAYTDEAMSKHLARHLAHIAFCCPFQDCALNPAFSPTTLKAQVMHIEASHNIIEGDELRPLLVSPASLHVAHAEDSLVKQMSTEPAEFQQMQHDESAQVRQHSPFEARFSPKASMLEGQDAFLEPVDMAEQSASSAACDPRMLVLALLSDGGSSVVGRGVSSAGLPHHFAEAAPRPSSEVQAQPSVPPVDAIQPKQQQVATFLSSLLTLAATVLAPPDAQQPSSNSVLRSELEAIVNSAASVAEQQRELARSMSGSAERFASVSTGQRADTAQASSSSTHGSLAGSQSPWPSSDSSGQPHHPRPHSFTSASSGSSFQPPVPSCPPLSKGKRRLRSPSADACAEESRSNKRCKLED